MRTLLCVLNHVRNLNITKVPLIALCHYLFNPSISQKLCCECYAFVGLLADQISNKQGQPCCLLSLCSVVIAMVQEPNLMISFLEIG